MGMTSHQVSSTRSLVRALGAVCAVGALTLLAACGDDEKSADTTVATADTGATAGAPVVTGAWARTSPSMATAGAAYATITSPVDDKLLAASVDASVAATVQIHETVMASDTDSTMMGSDTTAMGSDTTMMGGTDTTMAGGEMKMQPVEFIELPAGVAVELKPGGYHIMMLDLVNPLEVGTTIQITLTFEKAGDITVDVPVLDEAP